MQEQLYNMLLKESEITWQTILLDLIKSEQLNPWDIDLSILTKKYIEKIKQMKEANLFISGKMLLASALLLRIKSHKLVTEEILNFDNKMNPPEEFEEIGELYQNAPYPDMDLPKLTIRTPLPRKRKVNLADLMSALQKALEVSNRKSLRRQLEAQVNVYIPEKKIDISALILEVYEKITDFFKKDQKSKLTFNKLVNSPKKEDKVLTFIPLLHLDNEEKINLHQEKHFGDIFINIKQQ
ncbi:MAG: segregation/condensation protein A [Nanoarchaeota archaeon]|nr:segregation/condensation protein A [Nanoarchaeota archaeon]